MGLLEAIFPRRKVNEEVIDAYFKTLTAYNPVFTTFEGGVYEVMQTRAAIHAFANHISKLKPEIVGSRNERLARILAHRPNPYMNTSQFLYRTATIFAATNNAFIVPLYAADYLTIVGYYPLMPERVEIVHHNDVPYLRYTFANGQRAAVELSHACTLTQMQFKHDFFGESNAGVIDPTLQMIDIQNQGIINAVKNGAAVRFIAKLASTLKDATIKEERKRLREENLSSDNNGGFLLVDAKYADVKQIDSKAFIVDAEQMRMINENVYNYFGVNEAILQNKFTEEQFTAFYEGKLEPFIVQLGLGLTNMTFSDHEIAFGNEIMFSANRLQYASTQSKLLVSQQLFDRGILSQNDVCDIWNLPHIEGGDKRFIRGEYKENGKKEPDPPKPSPALPTPAPEDQQQEQTTQKTEETTTTENPNV